MSDPVANREQFVNGWSGKRLLKKHALSEFGQWQISGEDPNCDFGGPHYKPDLGIVEGTLSDIIDYAVELPQFWNWGSGGDIEKVEVKQIKKMSVKIDPDCDDVI